jgi:hypothetical protein
VYKPTQKSHTFVDTASSKPDSKLDSIPAKQALISKIMALQQQATNAVAKSEKPRKTRKKEDNKVFSL